MSFHSPDEIPKLLPERVIMQLHWYREPSFQDLLQFNGLKIVVLSRNPLDVLLSILHFVRFEPDTVKWLKGNAELPPDLASRSPTSVDFVNYAISWGAGKSFVD